MFRGADIYSLSRVGLFEQAQNGVAAAAIRKTNVSLVGGDQRLIGAKEGGTKEKEEGRKEVCDGRKSKIFLQRRMSAN